MMMRILLIALLVGATASSPAASTKPAVVPKAPPCVGTGIQQLRVYEIFERNKVAFHTRFRDHAVRIMGRYGFTILSMWESRHGDQIEFVYLLQWPNEAAMKNSWAAFLADEEWIRIKRETGAVHGRLMGEIEDRILVKTSYSPC